MTLSLDTQSESSTLQSPGRSSAATVALALVSTLLVFVLLARATDFVANERPELIWAWAAIVAAVAAPLATAPLPPAPFLRRFLRGAAAFLVFYFLTEDFSMPRAALPDGHPAIAFHLSARAIGLALAAAAWWRPGALVGGAFVLMMMRELNTTVTGFYFSTLDIRVIAEVIGFVALGWCLAATAARLPRVRAALGLETDTLERAGVLLLAAGIGAHLGNYFYSALAKLALDGGPLSWLLDNRLYDGIPASIERGVFPFAATPPAVIQAVYDAAKALNFPIQLAGLLIQFAGIVAPFRRRWVITTALAFDAFHILVYVLFGLIFWKWVALNLLIAISLSAMPDRLWDKAARAVCFSFAGAGVIFFTTATLAWYDASAFSSVYFEARTKDGRTYRVPNGFFDMASYQVSQGRLYYPPGQGHFAANIWGSVLSKTDLDAARACQPPKTDLPARYGPLEALTPYIEKAHANALARPAGYDYRWRLHHHMPSPFVAPPFATLDKREVAAYVYVVESVCLSLEAGRLKRRVLKRSEFPIYEVGS